MTCNNDYHRVTNVSVTDTNVVLTVTNPNNIPVQYKPEIPAIKNPIKEIATTISPYCN